MRKILTFILFALLSACPMCAEDPSTTAPAPATENGISTYDEWKNEMGDREKVEEGSFTKIFTRMLVLLLITVVALVAFSWAAKRFLSSRQLMANRTSRIQILERRPISPKSALLLIRVDHEDILLAESHSGLTYLKEVKKIS